MLTELAQTLGVTPDLVKIVACLVLNYPLCALVVAIPSPTLKYAFNLLFGLVYLQGIFSFYRETGVLVVQSMVAYIICYSRPKSTLVPWLNQLLQIGILMITHYREQTSGNDYVNEIGISGSQMILVIKLTSYVWDVYDGTRDPKTLNEHQLESRVQEIPGVLEYLSWCLFFPSVLTGPTCQFTDYHSWATRKTVPVLQEGKPVQIKVPSGIKAALFKTIEAVFWTWLFVSTSPFVSPEYTLGPRWRAHHFLVRAGYLGLMALGYQLKYYVAWTFSEAACILCGLGYNGQHPTKPNRAKWDRLQNVRPIKIITAQNSHGYINNWNINTAKWLRHYVYERVTPAGRRPGAKSTLATFVFSAVWHGTRPGYYLTFVLAALYQRFGRLFRHKVRPAFVGTNYKFAYDLVCWVVTQMAFGFAVQPFILLNMEPSRRVWGAVYYWPIVGCAVSYAVLVWPLGSVTRGIRRSLHKDLKENM